MPPPKLPPANQTYRVYPSFQGYTGNSSEGCTTPQIYLLPPSYTVEKASVVQLSLLFSGSEEQLKTTCGNPAFSLKFSYAGKSPVEPAAVLTEVTAGTPIWACNPSARAELRAKFVDFLEEVEKLEGTVLIRGAARRIALALADAIPAPLAETLFFRYGMNPESKTAPYVDVVPGMRLNVQAEASQYVSPGSPSNLYLPAGELSAEVGTTAVPGGGSGRVITFDPFLTAIRAPSVEGSTSSPAPVGGLVDLSPAGGARSLWRLLVPRTVGSPSSPGKLTVEGNFTLIGANSYAALEAATASYPNKPSGETPVYLIFPGRALVTPEIPIWITIQKLTSSEYVPLGTTLANIVQRYTTLPLSPSEGAEVKLTRLTTARAGGSAEVTLYTEGLARLEPQLFELPLIAGDSVTLNLAG